MKEHNINVFKRFLKNRGVDTMFRAMYRDYRFPDNPENYDDYLAKVDAYFVVLNAFDFNRIKAASDFDGHYWANLSQKWLRYLKSYNEEFVARNENPKPAPVSKDDSDIVNYDWSGLNLVPLADKAKRVMPQPQPLEIRVTTNSGNIVVFNPHITDALKQRSLLTMDMQVDTRSNRLVFVFGIGLTYPLRNYSAGIMSIAHKTVVETLQNYLATEFDKNKAYYIKIHEKMWSKDHDRCAIIVSNQFTEKDR